MQTEIKCPKCNTLMEEGYLHDRGAENVSFQSLWISGKPEESFWTGLKIKDRQKIKVSVFRCPNCCYLEFYAL